MPTQAEPSAVADLRAQLAPHGRVLIGHFGTFGQLIAPLLENVLSRLLSEIPTALAVVIGRRGERFAEGFTKTRPEYAGRLIASGELDPADAAEYIAACDLLVQPYPDGVSSRRTSVMAALALGVPVVTTTGHLTEPLWHEEHAVHLTPIDRPDSLADAAKALIADQALACELADRGRRLYDHRFAIDRTIEVLRGRQ
jgi:glycosyltransferase involved in cell wall biosynthesis